MKLYWSYALVFLGLYIILTSIFFLLQITYYAALLNTVGLYVAIYLGYNIIDSSTFLDPYFLLILLSSGLFWFLVGLFIGYLAYRYSLVYYAK
jgi:hydrogenase-4 membrane subunit HyfE